MRHTKKRSKQTKKSKKGARRYTRKGGTLVEELKLQRDKEKAAIPATREQIKELTATLPSRIPGQTWYKDQRDIKAARRVMKLLPNSTGQQPAGQQPADQQPGDQQQGQQKIVHQQGNNWLQKMELWDNALNKWEKLTHINSNLGAMDPINSITNQLEPREAKAAREAAAREAAAREAKAEVAAPREPRRERANTL